jgi:integrase
VSSVRKRTWTSPSGEQKTAWQVDYKDSAGHRRSKQFTRKKEADDWLVNASWEVKQGTHTPDSKSITVEAAAQIWLDQAKREGLEPTTIAPYEQHVRLHIVPLCGARKLSQLTKPMVEGFRDDLLDKLTRSMARRVLRSLSAIVAEAERRGYVAKNPCSGVTVRKAKRERVKPIIPSKAQMKAIIKAAQASGHPMDAPLVVTDIFCGLRASEVRGMVWSQVDLKTKTVTVDRRADAKNQIGAPKSAAGFRIIPLPDLVVSELRKWKLQCPRTNLDLVFPSERKAVMSHTSLHRLHLWPVQMAAGVCDGEDARYSSHAFRHCAASLWIEQRVSPKRVQTWMGHSSIQVTFDTYGHLFEQADADSIVMQAVEREVLGATDATPMQQEA